MICPLNLQEGDPRGQEKPSISPAEVNPRNSHGVPELKRGFIGMAVVRIIAPALRLRVMVQNLGDHGSFRFFEELALFWGG